MDNYFHNDIVESNKNQINVNRRFNLRILQLNIRSMSSLDKLDKLKASLVSINGNIDVVVIGETWIKENHKSLYSINGFKSVYSCRPDSQGGGLAVFVRNTIVHREILNEHVDGLHHIHVRLDIPGSLFDLHAFYRPPSYSLHDFFSRIETVLARSPGLCALVGDMNIPVNIPDISIVQDYRNLLNCYNFAVTNTFATRLVSDNILDHVVCSETLQSSVINETIFCDFSDHCFIMSTFPLKKPVTERMLQTTIIDNARLNSAFQVSMNEIPQGSSEEKLKYVIETYRQLRAKFSKVVTVKAKVKGECPWMTLHLWKWLRIK